MKSTVKWLLWGIAFIALIPVIIIAFINTPPGRSAFSSVATHYAGRNIELKGAIYPLLRNFPALHVSNLSVANSSWAKHGKMADIGEMEIAFSLSSALDGIIDIRYFSLVNSELHLERNAKGAANWEISTSKDSANKEAAPIQIGMVVLKNSVFSYKDDVKRTDVTLKGETKDTDLTIKGNGVHLAQRFSVDAKLAADCFTQNAKQCPVEALVTIGHTKASAKGVLKEMMPPKGVDVVLDVKGADAADLYPLIGLVSPPTPPYHLNGQLVYEGKDWKFNRFKGSIGKSDIAGSLAFDPTSVRPKVSAKLTSNTLRLSDLKTLIGIAPEQPLSEEQKRLAAQQEASPTIIPDLPLDIEKVSSMDADVTFKGAHVISDNLPLEDFYAHITLDDRLLKLKPVRFGSAQGDIIANVTINARKTPVQNNAHITFKNMKLAGLLEGVGSGIAKMQPATGAIGGTITLSGQGKSLHEMLSKADGVAGIGMEGGSISHLLIKLVSLDIAKSLGFILTGDESLPIRCLVADFDIKDGHMQAKSVVFDTADTVITAKGGINLEKERLGMTINPSPKNATLLSLRSPIDIIGTMKKPEISIQKGPLAQRGIVATGLAVLAPVAAVAAFVGTGVGEDSNCGALMKQMQTHTRTNDATDAIPDNRKATQQTIKK